MTSSDDWVVRALGDVLFEQPSRIVQDALVAATRRYWLDRAERFDEARPRPGDFFGARLGRLDHVPDDAEVRQLDQRIASKAAACRARAYVCDLNEVTPVIRDEIHEALGGAA